MFFLISGLLFSLFFLGFLYYHDSLQAFHLFYVEINLKYGNKIGLLERIFNAFIVRSTTEPGLNYFVKHLFLFLTILVSVIAVLSKKSRNLKSFFVVIFAIITVISISLPGTNYGHYYNFTLLSMPLVIGMVGEQLKGNKKKVYQVIILTISSVFFYTALKEHLIRYNDFQEKDNSYYTDLVRTEVSKVLIDLSSKLGLDNPKMAIFDWRNEIYVETGFMSATHYTMPERLVGGQVASESIVKITRAVYLEDLKKNKPEFFLLATDTKFSYWDMTMTALERMPDIHRYIHENYSEKETVDELRIYLRNDLFKD